MVGLKKNNIRVMGKNKNVSVRSFHRNTIGKKIEECVR